MLLVARLGELRAENDVNCTYEGENNVLIQQTSNWLLSQWVNIINGQPVLSPLGSADFLVNAEQILNSKFNRTTIEDTLRPESMTINNFSFCVCIHRNYYIILSFIDLLLDFKWLICYYLKKTHQYVKNLKSKGMSDFDIRNNSQAFLAHTLSLVYGEVNIYINKYNISIDAEVYFILFIIRINFLYGFH